MRPIFRSTVFIILLSGLTVSAALAQSTQKQGTGVITGRVMLKDKGIANVAVVLYPSDFGPNRTAVARATTDAEGGYKLTGIPAGRYSVIPIAPAMIGPSEGMYGQQGKSITLAEGEMVEKIDFSLVKGGVITGRVTDAEGAPVIGEHLTLSFAEIQQGSVSHSGAISYSSSNPFMYETDDRGIYRLYGVPAGQYKVSVGFSPDSGAVRLGSGSRGYYALTFYPNVTDESKATLVEVTEGGEASHIDITLGSRSQTFLATGRVVDESGQPVPNVHVAVGALAKDRNMLSSFDSGGATDALGRFQIDGLSPGRYAALIFDGTGTEGYGDPLIFEITEGNFSGLELKLHRGSSISGTAVIEGATDKSALAKLSQLWIGASSSQAAEGLMIPGFSRARVASDGTFQITGVRPGKSRLFLSTYPPLEGFTLARVERDGVPQNELEVAQGTQVTGIRIVIEYGTGSIRGLVRVAGDILPDGMRMMVNIRPLASDGASPQMRPAQVDARGRFLIEGLPAGEYEVTVLTLITRGAPRRAPHLKQNVTVTNGVESEVTFDVDLSAQPKEGGNNE